MSVVAWHHLSIEATLEELQTTRDGLTSSEAIVRLARHGRNEIVRRPRISPWRLLLKQFANFFVLVLLFAAALAYALSFLPNEASRRGNHLLIILGRVLR